MITPEQIHTLALQAGAARFYPEQQIYLVGQGFLEKFAELVEKHKLEQLFKQELEQKFAVQISTR